MENIKKVIDNGFCIGCGNCVYVSRGILKLNSYGVVDQSNISSSAINDLSYNEIDISNICPFSDSSLNEDEFSEIYYRDCSNYDKYLGYFETIYTGWDNQCTNRLSSSSGGLATFLISELLSRRIVGAAIVVSYNTLASSGVAYEIVDDLSLLGRSRQSKYVLASYHDILGDINKDNRDFVFIGVPCHVKSIRLLMEKYPVIRKRIKYTIAVFCGHQKTQAFREYISWQLGVHPDDLKKITYRVKKKGYKSNEYFYQVENKDNELQEGKATNIKWLDWGIGLFKFKACDFCDDVCGETADIVFGDAWVRPYTSDYKGTNLVICRNRKLDKIMCEARDNGAITLHKVSKKTVFNSQGANFRHRKEGTISRIQYYRDHGLWHPKKRTSLFSLFKENFKKRKMYVIRHNLAQKSHESFRKAKEKRDLNFFIIEMEKDISLYEKENRGFFKFLKAFFRKILAYFLFIIRKISMSNIK